jgi:hypothetical protein
MDYQRPTIQSLEHDAKIHAAKFQRDLKSAAAAACPSQGGLLAMGVLYSDEEWEEHNPPAQDPNGAPGVLIPVPRPTRERAGPIPPNATAARIASATKQDAEASGYYTALAQLKAEALSAAGPTIREELEDPEHGHSLLTILEIKQHIDRKYGTMLESDITEVANKLEVFPTTASLRGFIVTSLTAHRVLQSNGQPKSEIDKCQAFERALQQRFQFLPLVEHYKRANPLLQNRNFAALAAYCEEHESTVVPPPVASNSETAANGANTARRYSGKADQETTDSPAQAIAKLTATIQQIQVDMLRLELNSQRGAQQATKSKGPPGPATPSNATTARSPGSGIPPTTFSFGQHYCWACGSKCAHTSMGCPIMKADASYTQEMRSAKGPCDCIGLDGLIYPGAA